MCGVTVVVSMDFLYINVLETNSSHLKMHLWKRRFLLESIIFRCYVSFREGKAS